MMQKAESYVPAIVYAHAGGTIFKHAAVCIRDNGLIYISDGIDTETFLGIAMEAAQPGDPVLVQTDGVCYGWQGQALTPGVVYYTGPGGKLSTHGLNTFGRSPRVGIATDTTTLVFSTSSTSTGTSGGGGGSAVAVEPVYEFIRLIASPLTIDGRIASQWVPLKTPVKHPSDIYEIRMIGCGTLIPGVDYIITTTPPTLGAGVAPPSTALRVGGGGTVIYDTINFDSALLAYTAPAGEHSVLPRMRLGDRLLVVRKEQI